jgi:hypothetical protein
MEMEILIKKKRKYNKYTIELNKKIIFSELNDHHHFFPYMDKPMDS